MDTDSSAEVSEEILPDVPEQGGDVAAESPAAMPEPQQSAPPPDAFAPFRQIPQFQNLPDQEIAGRLYQSMQREQQAVRALQQYQSIVPAASEYLSNREMYQQWLQSRSQPQAPAALQSAPQQQEQAWWNPPKVNDAYRQYLVRDQNGREVISEGAPLDAQHQLAAYQAYKADFAQKFLNDPQGALGPMIEKIVANRAQEIAESQLSGYKEESLVQQIEAENRDWLYDQTGNVSREGLLVQKFIEDARGLGIKGAKARWDYATAMVERELALSNLQHAVQPRAQPTPPQAALAVPQAVPQQQPQQDTAQRNMEFLRQQASRTATRRANPAPESRVPQKPMTFAERMYSNLQGLPD
jgi:hypothetical protein